MASTAPLRVALFALLLAACATGNPPAECSPGQRRCQRGGVQLCTEQTRWSVSQSCPSGTACVNGACSTQCDDGCAAGSARCSPDGVQRCERSADGCGRWGLPTACADDEVCVHGACQLDCPIDCRHDELRCIGPSEPFRCVMRDGCPDWAPEPACGEEEVCSGGECQPEGACADQCAEGDVVCFDADHRQVCQRSVAGCLDWSPPEPCALDERCSLPGGCESTCPEPCEEGASRCTDGGRQTCVLAAAGCLIWGPILACAAGEACIDDGCEAVCQDECAPGARRCAPAGVQTCAGDGDCARWGAAEPCPPGTECAGDGDCGECDPGQEESRACGNCGTEQRRCGDARRFGDWGGCDGQGECQAGEQRACARCGTERCSDQCRWGGCEGSGECEPGATDDCGRCGQRRCGGDCRWGSCDGQGACSPGAEQACGQCGHQSCTDRCQWEACNNGDGTLWRRCNPCGWQFCCPNGNWCNCAAHFPASCPAGTSCVGAGVCQ